MKSALAACTALLLAVVSMGGNAEKAGADPATMQLEVSQAQMVPALGQSDTSGAARIVPSANQAWENGRIVPSSDKSREGLRMVPSVDQTAKDFRAVPSTDQFAESLRKVPTIQESLRMVPFVGQPQFAPNQAQPTFSNYNLYPYSGVNPGLSNPYSGQPFFIMLPYRSQGAENKGTADASRGQRSMLLTLFLLTLLNPQSTTTTVVPTTATTTIMTVAPTTMTTQTSTTTSTTTTTAGPFSGWIGYNSCRYLLYRTLLTHDAAETFCSDQGAHLAIRNMYTATDRSFLAANIGLQQSEFAWFGLEDADGGGGGDPAEFIDGTDYTADIAGDTYLGSHTPTCAFYAPATTATKVVFTDCGTTKSYSICEVCP